MFKTKKAHWTTYLFAEQRFFLYQTYKIYGYLEDDNLLAIKVHIVMNQWAGIISALDLIFDKFVANK